MANHIPEQSTKYAIRTHLPNQYMSISYEQLSPMRPPGVRANPGEFAPIRMTTSGVPRDTRRVLDVRLLFGYNPQEFHHFIAQCGGRDVRQIRQFGQHGYGGDSAARSERRHGGRARSHRARGRARLPVLIEGETGTGKELVAHAIHRASRRRGRFIPFNVCAIPESMFESTLFGHVRGAFTGALDDADGFLVEADHGTAFFDEIGTLLPAAQGKLLRALETGAFRPVGARLDRAAISGSSRPPIIRSCRAWRPVAFGPIWPTGCRDA